MQDGPFKDDNENWTRLVRMYDRMVTLRIDVFQYCENVLPDKLFDSPVYRQFMVADRARKTRAPFPFGLPFSAQEFLTICNEFAEFARASPGREPAYIVGSDVLFFRMVRDLAAHRINLAEFLADQVPESMEKDPLLLRLLAAAQGPHTQNYELNFKQFMMSCFKPPPGRIVGPLSHFQAAIFVHSLEEVDPAWVADEHKQMVTRPHNDCAGAADSKFVQSPCCGLKHSVCCIIRRLMVDGPRCEVCLEDQIEVRKAQLREQ